MLNSLKVTLTLAQKPLLVFLNISHVGKRGDILWTNSMSALSAKPPSTLANWRIAANGSFEDNHLIKLNGRYGPSATKMKSIIALQLTHTLSPFCQNWASRMLDCMAIGWPLKLAGSDYLNHLVWWQEADIGQIHAHTWAMTVQRYIKILRHVL